jgi:steroid delta-isomerase-like uncharacterized protein
MAAGGNKAIVERALARFNAPGDKSGYFELYAPDCVLHGYAGVAPGLEGIRQFYQQIWTAFPDCTVTPEDWLEEGDRVALRFTFRGTHQGEFQGIPPTGRPVTMPGITLLRFAGGRCVERWSQSDFLGLLQQLGASGYPANAGWTPGAGR